MVALSKFSCFMCFLANGVGIRNWESFVASCKCLLVNSGVKRILSNEWEIKYGMTYAKGLMFFELIKW